MTSKWWPTEMLKHLVKRRKSVYISRLSSLFTLQPCIQMKNSGGGNAILDTVRKLLNLLSMNSHSCTCWSVDLDWLKEVSRIGAQSWAAHHMDDDTLSYQIKIKYLVEQCYPEIFHITQTRLRSQRLLQCRNICFLQVKLKATAKQWVSRDIKVLARAIVSICI